MGERETDLVIGHRDSRESLKLSVLLFIRYVFSRSLAVVSDLGAYQDAVFDG